MTAVIEVHLGEDGVWDAFEHHVLGSEDLETIEDLDRMPKTRAPVRIGGRVRELTVYLEDDEDGFITWTEAYD